MIKWRSGGRAEAVAGWSGPTDRATRGTIQETDGSAAGAKERKDRRAPLYTRDFALLWLANFSFFAASQVLVPLLGLYVPAIGGGPGDVGLAVAIMPIAALPARLVGGPVVDRYGRRPLLLVGAVAFLAVTVAYHFAGSVPAVVGLRVAQGLTYAAFTTAAFAMLADVVPAARRGEGMGAYALAVNAAQAVAPAAGLALLAATDFGTVFWANAAAAALSLLATAFVRQGPAARPPARPGPLLAPRSLLSREALFPAGAMMAGSGAFSVIMAYATPYGVVRHVPNYNFFFTVLAVSMTASRLVSGVVSDRFGRQVAIIPGFLIAAAGEYLLALGPGAWSYFVAGGLFGLGFGAAQSAMLAFTVDRAPVERRGAAASTFMLLTDLAVATYTAIFGQLVPLLGYRELYAAVATLFLGGVVLYALGLARRL